MSATETVTSEGTRVRVTEQTGIHWSTLYLHTIPGAIKLVCLVSMIHQLFHYSTLFPRILRLLSHIYRFATHKKKLIHISLSPCRLFIGLRHSRLCLCAMQCPQQLRMGTILQCRINGWLLVYRHFIVAVFVPHRLQIQQNSMDESGILLLCRNDTMLIGCVIVACISWCSLVYRCIGEFFDRI